MFSTLWADREDLAIVKISSILQKYPTFMGFFLHIFMGQAGTKLELINIKLKSEKSINCGFKMSFLGSKYVG